MKTRLTSTNIATVGAPWRRAVQSARERDKVSITELAAAVGVTRQYLSRALDEGPTIPVETYLAICEKLGINPDTHAKTTKESPPWDSCK